MGTILNDVRYGAKMLWKSKGVTMVAIVSLTIGIGANSAIFSLVNSILFRPRSVNKPEQLVELFVGEASHPYETTSYPSYLELRDRNDVFTGLAAYSPQQFKLGGDNEVEEIIGEAVSGNYFDVLGIVPQRGRTFSPDEDLVPRRNPVAVVGYNLWQRRFNSDPELVGKTITVNDQSLTVIGILPAHYEGMMRGLGIDIWIPTMMMPALFQEGDVKLSRHSRWLTLVGRLKPETNIAQVRARFDLLARQMQAAHPEEWSENSGKPRELLITALPESETRIHPGALEVVYGVAALLFVIINLVLAIACVNLASMLLARAVTRRKEIAVRLAIGASRSRIIRQLLTESLMLSLLACAGGLLFAVWLLSALVAFMPALPGGARFALDLNLDWRVLVYTITFSTLTGILFGLAPALHASKADVSTVLKDDSGMYAGFYRRSRLRMGLVLVQVCFSLLLLVGAGLVFRSLEKIRPTRVGFSSDQLVVAPFTLEETKYDRAKAHEFYRQLSERAAALPGVQSASLVDNMPTGFMGSQRRGTEIEGYQPQPNEDMQIEFVYAGSRYFTNMKVPFVQGRDIDERDREGAPCVAIVNEAFGKRYFAGGSAFGRRLTRFGSSRAASKESCEIVGVIHDNEWQSLQKEVRPFYAFALQQSDAKRFWLLVSTTGDPALLVPAVRNVIRELDPRMPVGDVQTLNEFFSIGLFPFRMVAVVVGACGCLALLLATLGIYGVTAYSVAQRRSEIGIRMALGALQKDILKLVIGQGMMLVIAGLAAGLLLALLSTRLMLSLFSELELPFPISATDPLTFAGVTLFLGLVALIACYLPARRAAKIDPVAALRSE